MLLKVYVIDNTKIFVFLDQNWEYQTTKMEAEEYQF